MGGGIACTTCGADNRPDAKFCRSCGTAFATTCPRCGRQNAPGDRFCTECGCALAGIAPEAGFAAPDRYTPAPLADKIRSSAMEGERKLISVLFADVAGYTALSERLDPEEVRALMRGAFEPMLDEIHRVEGTVAQFQGDGLLALFGAPIAHEDHAQRAIRAALAIQDALGGYQASLAGRGIDLPVRIGIHSGLVVFGQLGSDLEFTFQAVGDTVNTASRVQGLAEPGTVVVTDATHRLAEGYFAFEDLGLHEVKNKAEPLHVHRALRPTGSRSRVDVSAERGLHPYVGRRRELELLTERYEDALAGRGQVVFVSGEAGIGKSRLLYELRSRLDGAAVRWLTGRCISFGAEISYVPIIDLARAACGIVETDPEDAADEKLTQAVADVGGDPTHLPYLRYLLSLDPRDTAVLTGDPQLRKARLFEAFRDVLLAAATLRPVVLVVEDLHWIDPLSAELLSYVADAVPEHRLLMVLTHRPDWTAPFGQRPTYTRLDLAPLSEEETALVAEGAFGGGLPAELESLIFRKAEGNPFFIEEVTKSLVETGVLIRGDGGFMLAGRIDDVDVPDTVQDVIMARLDRLQEEPRRALQTASVIGREFTSRLLERTAGEAASEPSLRELKDVQLIYERSLYPELVFMFKHALTHDVAYGSLLLERRRFLHGVVGEAIEELYADRLPEAYETLAHHFERAERWDEAQRYLVLSAEKSADAFAPAATIAYATRALEAMTAAGFNDHAALAHVHELRGMGRELTNQWTGTIDDYLTASELSAKAGDRAGEGRGLVEAAIAMMYAHRLDDGLETARRAEAIAAAIGDHDLAALGIFARLFALTMVGDLEEAYPAREQMEALARTTSDPYAKLLGLDCSGELLHFQGEEAAALPLLQEAAAVEAEHGIAQGRQYVLFDLGLVYCAQGRYDDAIAAIEEGVALAERLGDQGFWWCRAKNSLGWVHMDVGDYVGGRALNQEAVDRALVFGDVETLRNAQLNLADCALATGDAEGARAIFEDVERACAADEGIRTTWMKWRYTQHLRSSLSVTWLALGDPERALDYADRCIDLADRTGTKRYSSKGRVARARALTALGRAEGALGDVDEALAIARAVGNPPMIWRALAARGGVLAVRGEAEAARAAHEEALATIQAVVDGLADRALAGILATSVETEEIRRGAAD